MDNNQSCWYIHTETRMGLVDSKGQRVVHYYIIKFDPKNDMYTMYQSTTPQGKYWDYTEFHAKMKAVQERIYNQEGRGKQYPLGLLPTQDTIDEAVEAAIDNTSGTLDNLGLDKHTNINYTLINYLKDKWFNKGK